MRRLVLAALPVAAPLVSAHAQPIAIGSYECWYFTRAQPGLNFRIDSATSYTDVEGKRGTIALGPGNKLTFTGGAHDGSNAVYKPLKTPQVSFIGKSGAEAAFCELAK
jgi:hypothetical protein